MTMAWDRCCQTIFQKSTVVLERGAYKEREVGGGGGGGGGKRQGKGRSSEGGMREGGRVKEGGEREGSTLCKAAIEHSCM